MNKIEKHVNAKTIDEAVAALGAGAAVVAGGTDIYGSLKGMIYPDPPSTLVNIKTIPDLSYIKEEGGMLKIGALTKLTDIVESSIVTSKYPALAQAARHVGTLQLRNMGTIGGNICQAVRCWYYRAEHVGFNCLRKGGPLCYMVPGNSERGSAIFGAAGCFAGFPSDTAIPLTALGATVVTNSRSIAMADFYEGLDNVLDDNEIVTEIQVPEPASGTKQVYMRFAQRKALDFPEVSVAVVMTSSDVSIVMGGVSPVPHRATGAEDAVRGKTVDEALATTAGNEAIKGATALPGNKWKLQIAKTLVKRALLAA
jgi:xanthine dehydrogenase YagS FAD-binding subunit